MTKKKSAAPKATATAAQPVTPSYVEAGVGDGWYSIAQSLAPAWWEKATQSQKDSFAGYLTAANGEKNLTAPVYAGQIVCYNPAKVPTAPTPIPPIPPTPGVYVNRPPQSFGLVYDESNMNSVAAYAKPGGLVIAGRTNFAHAAFKDVSAKGGSVLAYFDPIIWNNHGPYHQMLFDSSAYGGAVPAWPGNIQANSWGKLADFRVGGVLINKLEGVLDKMVADNPHLGGFFLDDVGSRAWFPRFDWGSFGAANQQAYRDGAIAVVQKVRNVANRHGKLTIIVNGTWGAGSLSNGGGYPDMNKPGISLAEGGFVEHHTKDEVSYWTPYGNSPQWGAATTGKSFCVASCLNDGDRSAYIDSGAFAFVNTQNDYGQAPAPWGPLHPTGLASKAT